MVRIFFLTLFAIGFFFTNLMLYVVFAVLHLLAGKPSSIHFLYGIKKQVLFYLIISFCGSPKFWKSFLKICYIWSHFLCLSLQSCIFHSCYNRAVNSQNVVFRNDVADSVWHFFGKIRTELIGRKTIYPDFDAWAFSFPALLRFHFWPQVNEIPFSLRMFQKLSHKRAYISNSTF